MPVFFRIPNWSDYQQYKDRDPSWIKLHKRLLNNRAFMELPLEAKGLLPMLWLLASESSHPRDGIIEIDGPDIAFRLRLKEAKINELLTNLISGCFIEDVRNRTEPYTEKRRDRGETEERRGNFPRPESVSEEVWNDFLAHRKTKRAPVTGTVVKSIFREALKAGITLDEALAETCTRGWQSFKADWYKKPNPSEKPKRAGVKTL